MSDLTLPQELPSFRIYFHEDRDGSFVLEEESTGHRYLDMRPHDEVALLYAVEVIELFFYDVQEEWNLDGMSIPQSPRCFPHMINPTVPVKD